MMKAHDKLVESNLSLRPKDILFHSMLYLGYYISMRVPTETEMDTLPHNKLTSDIGWDPAVLDNDINPDDMDCDKFEDTVDIYKPHHFNKWG
jgi:hypothetical protein